MSFVLIASKGIFTGIKTKRVIMFLLFLFNFQDLIGSYSCAICSAFMSSAVLIFFAFLLFFFSFFSDFFFFLTLIGESSLSTLFFFLLTFFSSSLLSSTLIWSEPLFLLILITITTLFHSQLLRRSLPRLPLLLIPNSTNPGSDSVTLLSRATHQIS